MDRYTSTAIALIPLIMAGLMGCGPDTRPYIGTWTGTLPANLVASTPPDLRRSYERVMVTIRADGSATVVLRSMPYSGRWRGGKPITIDLFKILNKELGTKGRFSVEILSDPVRARLGPDEVALTQVSKTPLEN